MKIRNKWPLLILAGSIIVSGSAHAALTALASEPSVGTGLRTDFTGELGYGFYLPVSTTVTVNQLGYWDQGGDGLLTSHQVTLYSYLGTGSNYQVVASVTFSAGTSATLDGGYRWLSIPDTLLTDTTQGGAYYVVMATVTAGTDPFTDGGMTFNPSFGTDSNGSINFSGADHNPGTAGVINGTGIRYGGANVGFQDAIPEPSTTAIVALSILGLGFSRSRRRA